MRLSRKQSGIAFGTFSACPVQWPILIYGERWFDMSKGPVVGVAGCGSMGLPMAQALQDAGYEVWGLDVRPANEFGSFQSRMLEDPAEFARRV
jgi:hypothetical protein